MLIFGKIVAIFFENNPGLVVWVGGRRNEILDENFRFFDSGCTVNLALVWNPSFCRYSRSRTSVGWMAMVKKTDDCKTLNSETHTKADVFI